MCSSVALVPLLQTTRGRLGQTVAEYRDGEARMAKSGNVCMREQTKAVPADDAECPEVEAYVATSGNLAGRKQAKPASNGRCRALPRRSAYGEIGNVACASKRRPSRQTMPTVA